MSGSTMGFNNSYQPKRLRIRLRAVDVGGSSSHGVQPPCYTASLSDGLSVTCNANEIPVIDATLKQSGINGHGFDFVKLSALAEKKREVWTLDLGDRKVFLVPETTDEHETRVLTKALLDYASEERVTALSFTHFSFHRGELPKEQCRSIIESMIEFDASDGPYTLWFEVAAAYFSELRNIYSEAIRGKSVKKGSS